MQPDNRLRARVRRTLRTCFTRGYPYINLGYELALLGYNIAYIFDQTPYYRPWLQLMGIDLRRMSASDYVRRRLAWTLSPQRKAQSSFLEVLASPWRRHPYSGRSPALARVLLRYLLLIPRYAFEMLKIVLPTSIFFFKFLEWWYSSDYARSRRGASATATEPPLKPPTALRPPQDGKPSLLPGQCAICRTRPAANPTALPTGFICCYRCVHAYVQQFSRCPVMLTRVDGDALRRIVG